MSYEAKRQLTKTALCEALKRLLTTKSFNQITVGDITAEAGFNRQTFYYHFKDIYDLLNWAFNYELAALTPYTENKSQNTWHETLSHVINYISRNKYLCSCIFNGVGREQLMLALHDSIYAVIRHIVTHEEDLRPVPSEHLDFIVEFFAYAIGSCLYNWVKDGMRESPEELLGYLDFIINAYRTNQQ